MDPTTFNDVHVENLEDDNVEGGDNFFSDTPYILENLETQENNFFNEWLSEVREHVGSTPSPSEVAKKFEKSTKINTKPKLVKMKRKGRDLL
ncbi:hypothetical protein Hanom_Chr03g00183331 [Helianthus anomalus]